MFLDALLSEVRMVSPIQMFIVGVMAFAVLHHFLIGLRRPGERVHLLFAALCALATVWAVAGIPQYLATDENVFLAARRVRIVAGNGVGIALIWFLAHYTGVKPLPFLWGMTAIHAFVFSVELFRPFADFAGPVTLQFTTLPWGETVTDAVGPRDLWWYFELALPPIDFGFGIWASFRLWRRGQGREAIPVLIALAALMLGLFGVYNIVLGPLPSAEVAFLGLVLVMSIAASDRVVEASVMKDALEASEHRLRTLVETAPEAVLLLDSESGRALEANDRALDLFQLSRSGLASTGLLSLAPPEQGDGEPSALVFDRRVHEALRGGRPIFRWVVRGDHGQDVPCEARLVKLPGTEPPMLRLSLVDLQSVEEAEARQDLLEAQLRQSQRLEAVGRLTGGVAHDFNNFLTVVQGNLELLLEEEDVGQEESRDLMNQALDAAMRGGELTKRLLAFSRQQALESREIDVGLMFSDLARLLSRTLEEHIELEVVVPDELRTFKADSGQLESALVNIAINARDAMPSGGRLTLLAQDVDVLVDDPNWPEEAEPGPHVCISVQDTGEGMDEETALRAVDPFFTTKEVGKGSGLGLSMVYGFVTQSGGALRINSTPGAGTRICMIFPMEEDGADVPGAS